jgi:hypothetical protein
MFERFILGHLNRLETLESAVWMVCSFLCLCCIFILFMQMDHVWDHFDYTNDVEWWQTQGWPLVKVRWI